RDEDIGGAAFVDVAGRAGLQRAPHDLRVVVHRHHQYWQQCMLAAYARNQFDTTESRHRHVEQQHIALQRRQLLQQLFAIGIFRHDIDIVGKGDDAFETLAHQLMVIRYYNFYRHRFTANAIRTVVPASTSDSISRRPPSAAIRSRMPSNPKPPRRNAASTSKPQPLSAISSTRFSSLHASVISTS